jgi:acetyl-CoA C-acetyltransferase
MSSAEIYVVSAVRSAIGGFGGSLKDLPLADLASAVTRAAIERSGLAAEQVGHLVMGTVIPTEPRDAYLAGGGDERRHPKETPAFNVNRLCGSGLQAIVSAAQGCCWATPTWPWRPAPNP